MVVENFRPGTMETWGMGYEALSARPIRAWSWRGSRASARPGPYAEARRLRPGRRGHGRAAHITGEPDRTPARAGISIGDSLSGLNAALGVMMALHARQRTGRGQVVDAAIYESVLTVMENLITEYTT